MSDIPASAQSTRAWLPPDRFHLMRHVAPFFKDPPPLALSAASPGCRRQAEMHSSDWLEGSNLTHISSFNTANHCGVGLRERFNIVRVQCLPSFLPSSPVRETPPPQQQRLIPTVTAGGLVLLLDPPIGSVTGGRAYSAVVVHSAATAAGPSPRFEVVPCPREAMAVRDPGDHTYPFNTTRGVFSLEGLGDLEGGERYGRRQGCVQNYLDSLSDEDGASPATPCGVDEIVLVFMWVEQERGQDSCGAHRRAAAHLTHAAWWLARRPAHGDGGGPAPVFAHIYNGGDLSLFRSLLSSVPALRGLMCIHSPWLAAPGTMPPADEDPFAQHDDDADRYVDIGTALGGCGGEGEAAEREQLAALRYLGVSATPLTCAGLESVLALLGSLRHLAVYLNHSAGFGSAGCLGAVRRLRRVVLHTCPSLASVAGLERSTTLAEVNLASCINLPTIAPLVALPALQTLRVDGCTAVSPEPFMEAIHVAASVAAATVPGMGAGTGTAGELLALRHLSYLQLSELDVACDNLSALSFLPCLTALHLHLTATDNSAVAVIAGSCRRLQALSLAECFVVSENAPLAELPALSHLLLRNTITDGSLRRFCEATPPALLMLDVSECDDLTDCSCVAGIPTLERINAQSTHITVESVYSLVWSTVTAGNAPRLRGASLETADFRGCSQLWNISASFS